MNTFCDRAVTFSFYKFLALCFGISGLLLALAGAASYLAGYHRIGDAATILVVPMMSTAAVLRVRAWFGTLHNRWSAAFEAGRIVGQEQERERDEGHVRSLR